MSWEERVREYALDNELSKLTDGYTRKDEDKWRRYYLFYFLRAQGLSAVKVGKCFGLDHATVLNGIKKYHILNRYEDFRSVIEDVQFEFPLVDGIYADHKHLRIHESLCSMQSIINKKFAGIVKN